MPSYKLYTPAGSYHAFAALIAAEYNGIDVEIETENLSKIRELSPTNKAPVLVVNEKDVVFSSHSIARYLAGMRRDMNLLGSSLQEQAQVDSWMDFCALQLELPATVWWYPVAGYMPFHAEAYTKAKGDFCKALKILNYHLSTRAYLVGDAITLADITIASTLLYPFKLVADKAYLKPFGNMQRWFRACVNEPEFEAVVGKVVMCKKETLAAGQQDEPTPKSSSDAKQKKGPSPKKEKAAPTKKPEHPYKIMDRESPSPFHMDAWKKTYSNATNYQDAMKVFWDKYDHNGWSLWLQSYNHNEDHEKVFMVSNKIAGFQQRTDGIRRWAFGVMNVLGSEDTVLEVKGVWLLRGDSVDELKRANTDANWYTWTKLAGKDMAPTDAVKQQVADYWCSENELEGKPIQDSKVFK